MNINELPYKGVIINFIIGDSKLYKCGRVGVIILEFILVVFGGLDVLIHLTMDYLNQLVNIDGFEVGLYCAILVISLLIYCFFRSEINKYIKYYKDEKISSEELEKMEDKRRDNATLTIVIIGFFGAICSYLVVSNSFDLVNFKVGIFILSISLAILYPEKDFFDKFIKTIENNKKDEMNKNILKSIWASSVKVRKMMQTDYEMIDKMMLDLHDFYVKKCPSYYRKVEHMYSKDEYSNLIHDRNKICLVAEMNEYIIGFTIIEKRQVKNPGMTPMELGYMESIYIYPSYRMKGLGKALVQRIEENLIREGIQSLRLKASNFNKDAIIFFEKTGLKVESHLYVKELAINKTVE